MEGDESKPLSLPDDAQLQELANRVAENVVEFQHFVDDINEEIYYDEMFCDMTEERYNRKKAYVESLLRELSQLHNSLADECSNLIEDVSKQLKSLHSSSSIQVNPSLTPKFSKATGYELLWNPSGGGFYLSKVAGSSHSGSEASVSSVNKPAVPPVNDDDLNVKETKDPDHGGSDSGSASLMSTVKKPPENVEATKDSGSDASMSSVNKPAVPPVNDDALNVKETKDPELGGLDSGSESLMSTVKKLPENVEATKDSGSEASTSSVNKPAVPPVNDDALKVGESNEDLLEMISNLEEKVVSLKQKLLSVTDENGVLNQEIEDGITDLKAYMSESTPKIKAMKEELDTSNGAAKMIQGLMCTILDEKVGNQVNHDSEMKEMEVKINAHPNDISKLISKHEKEEKIWNGITEQLKDELKQKSESLADVGKKMEALIVDKSDQNNLIHKLETEQSSVKSENAVLVLSFENLQKIIDEMKLKLVELGEVVDKQLKAMSHGGKK